MGLPRPALWGLLVREAVKASPAQRGPKDPKDPKVQLVRPVRRDYPAQPLRDRLVRPARKGFPAQPLRDRLVRPARKGYLDCKVISAPKARPALWGLLVREAVKASPAQRGPKAPKVQLGRPVRRDYPAQPLRDRLGRPARRGYLDCKVISAPKARRRAI